MYWKLYVIENTLRVALHSVLVVQVGADWLAQSLSKDKLKVLQKHRSSYTALPKHANPGTHDIYLTFLTDLTRILNLHSGLFQPIVPDVAQWVIRLESIRLPRNLVSHMNFPNSYDRQQIDSVYSSIDLLIRQISAYGLPIVIP